MPRYFYAREAIDFQDGPEGSQYLRFTRRSTRDLWVSQDKANRFKVAVSAVAVLRDQGFTWELQGVIEYARHPFAFTSQVEETGLARARREGAERDVLKAALEWHTAATNKGSDKKVPKEEAHLFAMARKLAEYPEPMKARGKR